MVKSSVDICNMALIFIGANTIISLDDSSKVADICKVMYPQVLKEILEIHEWDCVIDRIELKAVKSDSLEYDFEYFLPEDCQAILEVYPVSDYVIEGRLLYANESELCIRYVKQDDNPKNYDITLAYVLAYKLAAEIAEPVTQKLDLVAVMLEEYEEALSIAKGLNREEIKQPEPFKNNEWTEAGRK